MFSRFLGAVLALTLLVQPVHADFSDVPVDHPHASAIQILQDAGVGSGARFYPERPVSLVEFLAMGFTIAGRTADEIDTAVTRFTDVSAGSWFAPYISEAEKFNLLTDYPDRLLPQRTLTRGEAVKLGLGIFGFGVPVDILEEEFGFRDVRPSHRLAPQIFQGLKLGVVDPVGDDTFGAGQRLSRGEAAELIVRLATTNTGGGQKQMILIQHDNGSDLPKSEILENVWNEIQESFLFLDGIDNDTLMYHAIQGLVEGLGDKYSAFLTPEENSNFNDELSGELEGIGAYLSVDEETGEVVIVSPIRGTPAEAAGLRARDIITHVDGEDVDGLSIQAVTSKIKGPAGTSVVLTILRGDRSFDVSVTRAKIEITSVDLTWHGRTAILAVSQFGGATATEFATAAAAVKAGNAQGLVLDLRNNPGGLLSTAVDMLGYFIPDNAVAAIAANRNGREDVYRASAHEEDLAGIPLVVLVNEGSASASEIVAAALQDHGTATVLGEQSFGKGTVQQLIFYRDGTALKLTVAHWLSPKRQPINNHGVTPDINATDVTDDGIDDVLQRALQRLD